MSRLLTISFCILVLALSACGSGNPNSETDSGIRVSVTPATVTVAKGATTQFAATVTGTTVSSVTWSVTGGDTYGTVDSNGVYTPPSTIPLQGTATVVATSTADTTQHGPAVISVTRGDTITFGTPEKISDYEAGTYNAELGLASIAVHEGSYYIYTTWADNRSGSYNIYFSRSIDSGVTFSAPVKINDDTNTALHTFPSVAVSAEGVIYIAWHDERNGAGDIYLTRSLDNGVTFSSNVRVNDGTTVYANLPVLTAGIDDLVYVAWNDADETAAVNNMYVATSLNGGLTFAAQVRMNSLTLGTATSNPPDIATDSSGNLLATWSAATTLPDDDVYFSRSTNQGSTFSAEILVNDDATAFDQNRAALTLDASNNIYIAWSDDRNNLPGGGNDIYLTKSTDNGTSFGVNVKVNNDTTDAAIRAETFLVADALGNLSVFWQDTTSGIANIYYAGRRDGGATFTTSAPIDDSADEQTTVSVATDSSGRLLPLWMDYSNSATNADIYMSIAQ